MLDPTRPGNVRDVNEAVNSIFDLYEGAEVREVTDPAMDASTYSVAVAERLPGIVLHLLHAQTNAPGFWIHAEHLNFDGVSSIDDLTRMFDAL